MNFDKIQIDLMKELCIQIDENDNVIGPKSKEILHSCKEIIKNNLLHRAFSVFIFNEYDELLVQQRSKFKITFPN